MKNIFTSILFVILFVSCKEEATIYVTNNISNVRLESVSFGEDINITSSLIPGETGQRTLDDKMSNVEFPMEKQLRFYMVKGDNRVLLYTKGSYTVNKDDDLRITLTNETEVINPMSSTLSSPLKNISVQTSDDIE